MTDITELAQLRAELSNPAVGSKDHLRKLALSLVEALEKARQLIDELENDEVRQRLANAEHQLYMAELAKHNLKASRKAHFRKRRAAEKRIAELESRTVKLPDEVDVLLNHLEDVLPFEVFQLIDAHKWNAVSRLSAAGIKVEGE